MLYSAAFTQFRSTFICGVLSLCAVFAGGNVQAQEDPNSGELLENLFRDSEQASESDAQQLLEQLERYLADPLDLNTADAEELLSMRLLNSLQVEQLIDYREKLGPLLNVYELQAVPGWSLQDIQRILPYIRVGTGLEQRSQPIYRGFYRGRNEMVLRWGQPSPPLYPEDSEGGPLTMAFRLKHEFDNRMRFGFTAETDAGEPVFKGSNRQGFDFYSFHFFLQNAHPVFKSLAIGDFTARFGQGLLLQTGFSTGKSAESISVARGGRKLGPYASFGEVYFLRGAATSITLGKWEATLLYSNRRRDANILFAVDTTDLEPDEIAFSALQSSGLHRTPSEIADEKALGEQIGGVSIGRHWRSGQVNLNGIYYHYDKPWEPSFAAYRQYVFAGQNLSGLSLDYDWHFRNLLLFGETARSDNGAIGAVNGLLLSPDRRTTLSLVHRSLARDYQSIYAAPFSESSTGANENGLYMGMEVKPGKPWRFNAYVDVWQHPWLRFGVDAPSRGWDYLFRTMWTPKKGVSFYALWQSENKEQTDEFGDISGLTAQRRDRLRLHAAYKVAAAVELRSRVEWTRVRLEDDSDALGYVAYQEVVYKALSFPVSGAFRYTLYDTDNYDARVYTYENDLFAALSVPAFSGRGSRYFFNLSWRVNDWLRLEGRFEQTIQTKVVTASNVLGRKSVWKLQARMKF